uniref:Methyltransferase domain-containing protein n=1 Tax=Zooxanthella nutricula TaxID=1333877 RepID=A0A6U6Q7Z2_9DINO|mmetsp:Transcript_64744/g.198000  ORF Transcript_64744/g.198000 Transcript_64744/m.198000 type:complete len:360 (+) Transcript_64744:66-1145(+)
MDRKAATLICLALCLACFLVGQLFPMPGAAGEARGRALVALRGGEGDQGRCSASELSAREAGHASGAALRQRLVAKWAAGGSVAAWDQQVPLDSAPAWNSPTIWDIWAPTYGCQQPVHVGGVGSSKWATALPLESKAVCNPHQMRAMRDCVIYSFGVGWDTTFEISMLRLAPHCKVRVFDPTTTAEKFWQLVEAQTPDGETPPAPPALDFVKVGLAAETSGNYREGQLWNNVESISVMTLEDIMKQQGDEHLSILKVDIEGSEWTALPQACDAGSMAKVDQLLLEVHMGGCEAGYRQHNRGKLAGLFEKLEAVGMRGISNIPNLVPVSKGSYPGCAEYTFVNKNGPFVTHSCGAGAPVA